MNISNNLVIYMSSLCNLECDYCYARKGIFKKAIEKKVLLAGVAKFLKSGAKNKKITFLGGEPFLHFNLIKAVLTFVRKEIKNDLPVHIFTNGLLINKAIALFIKRFDINLIVSINPVVFNGINGREIDGGMSGAKSNIGKILKYIDIQKTTASLVIEKESANKLFENILNLYKLGFRHIAWSPDITKIWNEEEISELKSQMLKLRRHYFQLIKNGRKLYEIANAYEIMDEILKRPVNKCCMSAILCPDGNFIPCDKLIGSDRKDIKKYASRQISGGKKKALFFKEASKYGAKVKALMCPVGAFAFQKYILAGKASEIKKAVRMHIKLSGEIEKNYFSLFKQALKYPAFKKVHNIDG
ncbi:MAG: 4Fe-4S cluster-binding domain-containing protein [Elusimicrobiales bacterium]|nr:4Fe-4S cluster-binding domain-containing protein [Elusimicrobiales bacterium]